jgi:hypothetical protein
MQKIEFVSAFGDQGAGYAPDMMIELPVEMTPLRLRCGKEDQASAP